MWWEEASWKVDCLGGICPCQNVVKSADYSCLWCFRVGEGGGEDGAKCWVVEFLSGHMRV